MKTTTMRWHKSVLTGLTLCLAFSAFGSKYEEVKEIHKAYKVDSKTYLEIENKYGSIDIESWDVDSVILDIEIMVRTDDYGEIRELFEMINVNVTQTSGFILAETSWSEDASFFKKGWLEVTQNLGAKDRVEINYKVKIPSFLPVEIRNKFGDVFAVSHEGDFELDLSHGDFRARNLTGSTDLKCRYGRLKVNNVKTGKLDLGYMSGVDIKDSDDLFINSAQSEIQLGRAGKVQLSSKYDDISIDEVDEIAGFMSLTDLYIEKVNKKVDISSKYGEAFIKEVGKDVILLNLEGQNTDYQIGFSPFFSSRFEVSLSEKEEFSYDELISVSEESTVDKSVVFNGRIGDGKEEKVKVVTKNGYVKFGQ